MITKAIFLLSCFYMNHALYSPSDDVVELNADNFHKKVVQSDEVWLVEFYAPWCGHCKNLAPDWKKAATALKGVVKVGAVDADQHRGLGGQFGVKGFPSIKIFAADKFKPKDYQGGRTAKNIVETGLKEAKSMVDARMGGGGQSGGGSSGGGSGGSGSGGGKKDAVIELTDSNFQNLVLDSEDLWMVEFFAPWCGHCKSLAPHWASAASQLDGKVKFGAVDATIHQMFAQRYGVQGYPTIKMFPAGKKDGNPENYDGGRTASDIVSWLSDKFVEDLPVPEVVELIGSDTIKDNCQGKQLCVVSVLPHILDCQSKCRNSYIKILQDMAERFKKHPWGYVWAEAMAQPELESALGIGGFGYPAMAAINTKKMMFALLKGPFSDGGIKEFLRDLSYGKGSVAPVPNAKMPEIAKISAWDGKDGVLEVEDDIDLSDVELDDLKDEL